MQKHVNAAVERAKLSRQEAAPPAPTAIVERKPYLPPEYEQTGRRIARKKSFTKLVKEALDRSDVMSQAVMRRLAAAATGAQEHEVPADLSTPAEFAVWVASMLATAGSIEHLRELSDRAAPKPRRVEVTGEGGGPVRHAVVAVGAGSGAAQAADGAAERYYAMLNGGGAIDAEIVEEAEASSPAAPADLSFLE